MGYSNQGPLLTALRALRSLACLRYMLLINPAVFHPCPGVVCSHNSLHQALHPVPVHPGLCTHRRTTHGHFRDNPCCHVEQCHSLHGEYVHRDIPLQSTRDGMEQVHHHWTVSRYSGYLPLLSSPERCFRRGDSTASSVFDLEDEPFEEAKVGCFRSFCSWTVVSSSCC